jgi:hypothetical protein
MAELQELLKKHAKDPISKDNLALLEKSKKEFKIENNAAVEDKWAQSMSAEEKASRDPRRYLREIFPLGEAATGVIVVKAGGLTNGNTSSGRGDGTRSRDRYSTHRPESLLANRGTMGICGTEKIRRGRKSKIDI